MPIGDTTVPIYIERNDATAQLSYVGKRIYYIYTSTRCKGIFVRTPTPFGIP